MMHNEYFGVYFKKKKAEGKHYFTAMVATARKFLIVIYTLLKKGEAYKQLNVV